MVAFFKKIHISRRVEIIIVTVLVIIALLVFYALHNLNPLMLSMAEARTSQLAVEAINQAVFEIMSNGVGYSDLITVKTDQQGQVKMLQANTLLMNELASQASLAAQRNLGALENQRIELPLGSALGVDLFSGSGPRFKVSVIPVGSVTTRFVTAFESAGINQTRHEISLEASIVMRIVVPTGANSIVVNAYVPVAESIIVGDVPDTFIQVPSAEEDVLNLVP